MATSSVSIRPVQETDLKDITRIYAGVVEAGTASWEWTSPDLEQMQQRCNHLLETGYPYLVAISGDTLAGYAYAGPFRFRDAYQWTVEDSVYVNPAFAEQGIGSSLLGGLVDVCTKSNFRQMIAVIGGSDNIASVKLHERHGFVHAGKMNGIGWKAEQWHDWILMVRSLGEGNTIPPNSSPGLKEKR